MAKAPNECVCHVQVGYSAIVFYGYVGVIGLALWAMLKWWFKSEVGLAQVWCIYGVLQPHRCIGW